MSWFGGVSRINWRKTTFHFNKIEIQVSVKFTKCSLLPIWFFLKWVVHAARKTNLITARVRKNKSMFTNARKPLLGLNRAHYIANEGLKPPRSQQRPG